MAPVPTSFLGVQAAIEDATSSEGERLVARLKEKARMTRSREQDALAWFAKGVLEAKARAFPAAEQSLLVAVNVGRDLLKEDNEALGHCARALGFVYARLDRVDAASEMFLLARNAFLRTRPELAPEVIRYAASCNIALKLPDHALAIVHQELGAPDDRSVRQRADTLDLHLIRARAFEDQHRPVQALKTLARTTQLVTDDPRTRAVAAAAWLQIARTWRAANDRTAAVQAVDCAAWLDGGRTGSMRGEIAAAFLALDTFHRVPVEWTWHRQRAVGDAVAFASPARGLFFDRSMGAGSGFVAAEPMTDGRWAFRLAQKLAHGWFVWDRSYGNPPVVSCVMRACFAGEAFAVGDTVHVDDGVSESVRRVTRVRSRSLKFDGITAPSAWRRHITASVWAPGQAGRLPRDGDDTIQELLKETA